MAHSDQPLSLRDAIRTFTPSDKWAALLNLVGGSEDAAISALSGRPTGRLALDAARASISVYEEAPRKRVRAFQKLRAEIIDTFEVRRRSAQLVLRGYTVMSPTKLTPIPRGLSLDYDFAHGIARTGQLEFHGITVRAKTADAPPKAGTPFTYPRVSNTDLEKFCQSYIANASSVPSMDALWEAAKKHFAGNHVVRGHVRGLHQSLIDPLSRKRGPRRQRQLKAPFRQEI
jgi:hypothetical protein